MVDTIIVGAGPAGLSTAIYNATEHRSSLILERGTIGGQAHQSARIDNYLGFPKGVSGKQLTALAYRQAKEYGAVFERCGALALGIEGDTRLIQTTDGRILAARSIVVATGLEYRRLNIPGVDTFGVFYGANPDEASNWQGKDIAIIGGANSAGQAAVNFATFARSVYMLTRSPIEKGMSAYLRERVRSLPNISILNTEPVGFSHDGRLTISTSGPSVEVDGAFLFIGAEPNCDWLPCAKDSHGFILCGTQLPPGPGPVGSMHETSIRGVYAAGDVRAGSSKRVAYSVGEGAAVTAQLRAYLSSLE